MKDRIFGSLLGATIVLLLIQSFGVFAQRHVIRDLRSKLVVAEVNRLTLEDAIRAQNAANKRLAEDSARRLAAAERRLTVAHSARPRPVVAAPVGETVCDRVEDLDAKLLESIQ